MIEIVGMAHGGAGVGRVDGKAVFVPGGLEGDVVRTELVEDRGRFERHRVLEVVERSPIRVEAPCPHADVCGGCSWQSAAYSAQLRWKRETVESQLRHVGGIEAEVDLPLVVGPALGYRNRMDFRNSEGRPALFRAGSHELVGLTTCLLLVPELQQAFAKIDDLGGVRRLVLRHGQGGPLAIYQGRLPGQASDWGLPAATEESAVIHQEVEGALFRVSGTSFFQVNTAGAAALVQLVGEALQANSADVLLDGYAGGGLFTRTVGANAGSVVAVESDAVSVGDLLHNTLGEVRVLAVPMEEAMAQGLECDLAVVDPPRSGLGKRVVGGLANTGARAIASVSCDPASFARDAGYLEQEGFRLEWVRPVDMFPQTPHIEIVARFVRG